MEDTAREQKKADHEAELCAAEEPPWRRTDTHLAEDNQGRNQAWPSPWSTTEKEETASRAAVRHLRHSRLGPGGWTSQTDVVQQVADIRDSGDIAWLARHSFSRNSGARLQTRWADNEWQVRATPRLGAVSTPWERGARASAEGTRARGPRSLQAIRRRQETSAARRAQL